MEIESIEHQLASEESDNSRIDDGENSVEIATTKNDNDANMTTLQHGWNEDSNELESAEEDVKDYDVVDDAMEVEDYLHGSFQNSSNNTINLSDDEAEFEGFDERSKCYFFFFFTFV